ncbi:MAG: prepilin-type N-terminal cleavage/methylation domain-containing protein [Phycisphaerales bacterium JB059]
MHPRVLPSSRAFSLVELVIVVAILAIIGAIAIPRVSASAGAASESAMVKDWRELQTAAELFAAEHAGLSIGLDAKEIPVNADTVATRLLDQTNLHGTTTGATPFGPYLDKIPANRENNLRTLRVDGADAGAGTHGWRLDSASGVFAPDTAEGVNIIKNLTGSKLDLGGVAEVIP